VLQGRQHNRILRDEGQRGRRIQGVFKYEIEAIFYVHVAQYIIADAGRLNLF